MNNQVKLIDVLESFLHDVREGESDIEEITNVFGYNEFKELLELAKQSTSPVPTIKPRETVVKDLTTRGTCDAYEIGEIVQDILDANPDYNKVYVTNSSIIELERIRLAANALQSSLYPKEEEANE
ncbi:hypothetical protein ACH6EH_07385 [Paenibacillus sp. JSM ZJ436]|uniref:hypothetical protein n=1 Tax=Paenibacillus sp. JSM ZJ436 TaxID=3376190 RepID=UPI0037B60285